MDDGLSSLVMSGQGAVGGLTTSVVAILFDASNRPESARQLSLLAPQPS